MDSYIKGYFCEEDITDSPQIISCIKVDELIHEEQSKYQHVVIFKNDTLGLCLALDDAIQLTEKDEFAYQEMISFLPLNSHPNPQKVLIIGGGDGGVVREVLKHPSVEEITLCEIDEAVVRLSRKYLPFMSKCFDDPKVKILIEDGYEFIRNHKNSFDIIITDSSDPKGPAISLFQKEYYQSLHDCLRFGGIISCQAESIWFHLPLIQFLYSTAKRLFSSVAYASILVPTYPAGQIGFLLASKGSPTTFDKPFRTYTSDEISKQGLRYYSTKVHQAAFTLPFFVERALEEAKDSVASS